MFDGSSYNMSNLQGINLPSKYKLVGDSNVKMGDFNFDGYPDMLGIYSVDGFRKVSILSNEGSLQFRVLDADLAPL